jgi:hypothetical protein
VRFNMKMALVVFSETLASVAVDAVKVALLVGLVWPVNLTAAAFKWRYSNSPEELLFGVAIGAVMAMRQTRFRFNQWRKRCGSV